MIYDIINEGKIEDKVTKVESELKVFFEHMAKWRYWNSSIQYSSWPNTIFRNIWKINTLIDNNKNVYVRSNKLIKSSYEHGIDVTSSKSELDIKKLDKGELLNAFSDLDSILNKEYVKDWMLRYSKNDISDKYVIRGYIHDYDKNNKKGE